MFYDELALLEVECARTQRTSALTASYLNIQAAARIEMIVGPWYLDEFGNQTREIKARD
jgi:hypothetical protein